MGSGNRRAPRSANATVSLSLRQFTERLGNLFGVNAEFRGPGPTEVGWSGDNPNRERRFAVEYLFGELFSKFDDGVSSDSKWEACLRRFYEAEELCRDTNWRFKETNFLYRNVTHDRYSVANAFRSARRKISWLLGPYDDAKMVLDCGFGKGATTRLPRRFRDLGHKLGDQPQITIDAMPFMADILRYYPRLWGSRLGERSTYEIVRGNNIVSVPKNYKTDRMIAIEPDCNMFLQKGIGGYIRRQLSRVGVNLDDQTNNAFAAGVGSITNELATIDLSMASDCVSVELVRFLLPPDWYDALEQCRSPFGTLPSGEIVAYQKFSSMGNGYTFELESLIFWALCSAVLDLLRLKDRRLLVYGDDIVVPSYAAQHVIEVLTYAGFVPNAKKSFVDGPFRESCGSHFYEGSDVTPIYVREPVQRLDRLFLLHNNCARLLRRFENYVTAGPEEVSEFLSWLRSHAPDHWQKPRLLRLDVGDGAFYGSFEEVTPKVARCGWEGYRIKILRPVPKGTFLKIVLRKQKEKGVGFDQLIVKHGLDLVGKSLWRQENSLTGGHINRVMETIVTRADRFSSFEPDGRLRHSDLMDYEDAKDDEDVVWLQSEQITRTLSVDYCWWHLLCATE